MDTYIPHMALVFWMRDEHIDLSNSATCALLGLFGLDVDPASSGSNPSQTLVRLKAHNDFAQEAIIDGVGLEAFCRRLELDINHQYHPEDLYAPDYHSWGRLIGVICASKVLPALIARGILDSLMSLHTALARMPDRAYQARRIYDATYNIYA